MVAEIVLVFPGIAGPNEKFAVKKHGFGGAPASFSVHGPEPVPLLKLNVAFKTVVPSALPMVAVAVPAPVAVMGPAALRAQGTAPASSTDFSEHFLETIVAKPGALSVGATFSNTRPLKVMVSDKLQGTFGPLDVEAQTVDGVATAETVVETLSKVPATSSDAAAPRIRYLSRMVPPRSMAIRTKDTATAAARRECR